ncbi:bacteriohemerythrin [Acinetobacter baumannii]|uniref:bacteriohemerythrin n=1 Tax=Acinetobacter baumannii TaxID=470 RepID=UPI0014867C50|nr:bacteriohemerythrin [Acinetobacter baumannii]
MKMKWASEYNTGIDVIDEQHKRILDYINEIDDVKDDEDRRRIKDVLDNIIDYTQSHFTFEESLQEEADYKYRVPHKRVHDLANSNMRCDSLKSLMIINKLSKFL